MILSQLLAKINYSQPGLWQNIGDKETKFLKKRLKKTNNPIYICGLARAGTTITLEAISQHPDSATHSYRDFPMMFTPYFWNKLLDKCDKFLPQSKPQERSHKDGILVTPKSPEAMEEILWMAFFKDLHQENSSSILDKSHNNPIFSKFYQEHIQKLLLAHNKTRYVSKANYNITRLNYLNSIFDDAKFIILVRDPVTHISSLMKLDKRFAKTHQENPSSLKQMNLSGHFEFGLDRKLICTDIEKDQMIKTLFQKNKEIEAWAHYWNEIYSYILKLAQDKNIKNNIKIIIYEDFCQNSEQTLTSLFNFCQLSPNPELIAKYSKIIKPTTTNIDLNEGQQNTIKSIAGDTYLRLNNFSNEKLEDEILANLGQEAYNEHLSSKKDEIAYDDIRKELNLDS